MNKLFQQLNPTMTPQSPQQQQSQTQDFKDVFKQAMKSSNPKQLLNNIIANNPKMQNLMQAFQASQMTPKQFFYQYAQQKGINPEQFLQSLM